MSDFSEMMRARNTVNIDKELSFNTYNYTFDESFQKKIECEDYIIPYKGRRYKTPEGNVYPSITTILGKSKSEADKLILENWKKREGPEKAKKITEDACIRGTAIHKMVEDFIGTPESRNTLYILPNNNFGQLFKTIYPELKKINNIHCVEVPLYNDLMGVAGRVDLIAEYNGKLSVIDFKTSSKEKEESYIQDYLLQETFYSLCFSELYGKKIEQIVTIIAVEDTKEMQVFVKSPIDYVGLLVKRVKKFYMENEI